MFGDSGSEGFEYPVVKMFRSAVLIDVHAFHKADHTLFDNFRRKAVCIRLEWIGRGRRFRINCGKALVTVERVRKKMGYEVLCILISEVNQVACAVERESIL